MSTSTAGISDAVHARIFDQKKPVTARWICYEHMCNMCTAQALLQQLLKDHGSKVTVTRLIDGEPLAHLSVTWLLTCFLSMSA